MPSILNCMCAPINFFTGAVDSAHIRSAQTAFKPIEQIDCDLHACSSYTITYEAGKKYINNTLVPHEKQIIEESRYWRRKELKNTIIAVTAAYVASVIGSVGGIIAYMNYSGTTDKDLQNTILRLAQVAYQMIECSVQTVFFISRCTSISPKKVVLLAFTLSALVFLRAIKNCAYANQQRIEWNHSPHLSDGQILFKTEK